MTCNIRPWWCYKLYCQAVWSVGRGRQHMKGRGYWLQPVSASVNVF